MACDIEAAIANAIPLQGELYSFSQVEILRALYEIMCVAGGVNCDPYTYLNSIDPCVACLSEEELLAGIAAMRCAQGGVVPPADDAWSSAFGPGFGGGGT